MRAVIFDLDSCLSAADEVGQSLYAPAFAAIRRANRGTLSEEQLAAAFAATWRFPLDVVAREHGFSREMLEAGWEEFRHLEVTTPMHGYGDLDALRQLDARRFLVTSGFRRLQESKVRALGLPPLFTEILVDAIDEPDHRGKAHLFADLLGRHRLSPRETMVVGDNPASEIKAGNDLGLTTVQILRPGVARGDNAHHYIRSLHELVPLVAALGATTPSR